MKIKYLFLSLAIFLFPFLCSSCSCGLEKYKSIDIQNLYKTTVENQIDSNDGLNSMFSTDYTIYIDYAPMIKNINLGDNPTPNEYNLYALENIYNPLFESIFRYYENWNENFYETADEVVSIEEFNELYNRLNSINSALLELNTARDNMESIISQEGFNNTPSYSITSYINVLNNVVEKSIDFVSYFRDIHVSKIFTYSDINTNTVSRTLDDMLLNFSKLVYVDNILPFVINNGSTNICDISVLVEAYINNNQYVKFYALEQLNTVLRADVIYALDNSSDPTILNQADEYMYYSNILRQNILTLESVSANINYYRLCLYRFEVIDGGVEEYSRTISGLEHTSYIFLSKLEDFITFEYLQTLNNLT